MLKNVCTSFMDGPYLKTWGHYPLCGSCHDQWPSICTQYNFINFKRLLRLNFNKSLVKKQNQVCEKRASMQSMQSQKASEWQVEFWVRKSKIRQILFIGVGDLLWWLDHYKLSIFWNLTRFWIDLVTCNNILSIKTSWSERFVTSSRKHPVEVMDRC